MQPGVNTRRGHRHSHEWVRAWRVAMLTTSVLFVTACGSGGGGSSAGRSAGGDAGPGDVGAEARAITTFESMGLYWSPDGGGEGVVCEVRYQVVATDSWKEGLPLWFDPRDQEYRGSLVGLDPGTRYEVELALAASEKRATVTATTWSDDFPIVRTILIESSADTLEIVEGGDPAGYVLYTGFPGETPTIDVRGSRSYCVDIRASYVVVRGLVLRSPRVHCVRIDAAVNNVVIERSDLAGWGRQEEDFPFGRNFDSGIFCEGDGETPRQVVIQDNEIHHPRYDSNNWGEIGVQGNHPSGPQAISLQNTGGNHVIRYNAIYSSEDHYFNDGMGEWRNFTWTGFPNRDSDIYGNYISHCWDDAIEAEGANSNVRIWGNFIDRSFSHIATVNTNLGPLYVWRNVSATAERQPGDYSSRWLKTANSEEDKDPAGLPPRGRVYLFHNTVTQPDVGGNPAGCAVITDRHHPVNLFSRNNIFWTSLFRDSVSLRDATHPSNDLDYDLFNGVVEGPPWSELHGIAVEAPVFRARNAAFRPDSRSAGEYFLAPRTPGHDGGVFVPNFSDDFRGSAPDVGAYEDGAPPLHFGPRGTLAAK